MRCPPGTQFAIGLLHSFRCDFFLFLQISCIPSIGAKDRLQFSCSRYGDRLGIIESRWVLGRHYVRGDGSGRRSPAMVAGRHDDGTAG